METLARREKVARSPGKRREGRRGREEKEGRKEIAAVRDENSEKTKTEVSFPRGKTRTSETIGGREDFLPRRRKLTSLAGKDACSDYGRLCLFVAVHVVVAADRHSGLAHVVP